MKESCVPGYLGYGLWRHLSFGSEMFFVLRRCECHCYSWVTTWGVWALIGDSVESVFFHSGHSAKWFPVYQYNPSTRMVLHLHCLSQVFPVSLPVPSPSPDVFLGSSGVGHRGRPGFCRTSRSHFWTLSWNSPTDHRRIASVTRMNPGGFGF